MISIDVISIFRKLALDCRLDPFSVEYCTNRIENEGIQFLTKTLPGLGKAVLRSLELGYFDRPTSFEWKGRTLRYFGVMLNKIFDRRSGLVLESVDANALKRLRTLCEYCYKLALPFDESDLDQAETKFIETDESLARCKSDSRFVDQLRKDAETYFRFCGQAPWQVFARNRPRCGPGTFSGKSGLSVPYYVFRELDYNPSEAYKGMEGYFKPYPSAPVSIKSMNDTSTTSEVLFVPKDSRGPRTIVREPYRALMGQMGFHDWITSELERATNNRVNFRDQSINRELARSSSISKEYSTYDLKDASDRVDTSVIRVIFRNAPAIRYFVLRRTATAKLPSGKNVQLKKLSGMGSGLTFPLMSFLIYLAVVRQIANDQRIPYRAAMRDVYVYGDDLIVKTAYSASALEALTKVKLQVNVNKSFTASHFRESCGGDYYNGVDVAPVRIKLSGCDLQYNQGMLSVDGDMAVLQIDRHCRELVKAGFFRVSNYLYSRLEKVTGELPNITGDAPVIGRYTTEEVFYPAGANGQYPLVKVLLPVSRDVKVDRCPYKFLSSKLCRYIEYDEFGLPVYDQGSAYDEVTVPRSVKYVRKKISAYRLMG